jgi:hypothetical protein
MAHRPVGAYLLILLSACAFVLLVANTDLPVASATHASAHRAATTASAQGETGDFRLFLPHTAASKALRLTEIARFGGVPWAIAAANGAAYVGLALLDVTDPVEPHVLSRTDLCTQSIQSGVAVERDTVFVACNGYADSRGRFEPDQVLVVDTHDRDSPGVLARIDLEGVDPVAIAAENGLLSIAHSRGVTLWDVSEPKRPKQLAAFEPDINLRASALTLAGDHLYANSPGLTDIDVSDPRQPRALDALDDLTGDLVTAGGGMVVAFPRREFLQKKDGDCVEAFLVRLVAHDVSRVPDRPRSGSVVVSTWLSAYDLATNGREVYVALTSGDVAVLRVSR